MADDREELELSEDFPAFSEHFPAANRKRPLSAVRRFFKRGVKDCHNKYSAACLTLGCG
jgi:hypothetical protein